METKRTRRSFSPEFKKQAVQRVLLLKEPATNVSAELEIKPETLSKWIKDYEKMVAEDPSYAAAGAPKRPVIKLAKKKTAPDTNESLEVQPENPVAQESVPTAPVFEQVETKVQEARVPEFVQPQEPAVEPVVPTVPVESAAAEVQPISENQEVSEAPAAEMLIQELSKMKKVSAYADKASRSEISVLTATKRISLNRTRNLFSRQ